MSDAAPEPGAAAPATPGERERALEEAAHIADGYDLSQAARDIATRVRALATTLAGSALPRKPVRHDNGHAEQAGEAIALAVLLDEKRVAGGSVVLSQKVAADMQRALESAENAHLTLAGAPGRAAPTEPNVDLEQARELLHDAWEMHDGVTRTNAADIEAFEAAIRADERLRLRAGDAPQGGQP